MQSIMAWNWELAEWPNFAWDAAELAPLEQRFLLGSGELAGVFKHLEASDQDELVMESLSNEAMTTSEIEGETLDRASVQSSIKRQLGIATEPRRVPPAEQGIAEIMVDAYRSYANPLHHETLFSWHRSLMAGRTDLSEIGQYRTTEEPMQIVSAGRFPDSPTVHFEAPPSNRVADEMNTFLAWFNAASPLPALTRAGIAHLYFESIHPFADGNGRLGRAISEKAIAQNLGRPTYSSLASVILSRRRAYYDSLERASRIMEVTEWLLWFGDAALEAQRNTTNMVEFILAKTQLFDRLRGQLNPRQEKALRRMFQEGPDGFKGGLSAGNYSKITGAPPATTTRDLSDLVEKGALSRVGENRHTRYYLNQNAP